MEMQFISVHNARSYRPDDGDQSVRGEFCDPGLHMFFRATIWVVLKVSSSVFLEQGGSFLNVEKNLLLLCGSDWMA